MNRAASTKVVAEKDVLDVDAIARQFPILNRRAHGQRLVYLDNAATTQKPQRVIDALCDYYQMSNAGVHRGVHQLSVEATASYEGARGVTARFLGASGPDEIVFVRGVTEAINLLAQTLSEHRLDAGDEVIVSLMEHHSNLIPWQRACARRGATLRVIPLDESGELRLDEYDRLLTERTKIVAVAHVSNVLGTINPIDEIVRRAKSVGAITIIDGAQAASHLPIDVSKLGCDFYAISGHKMYAPTGIGALYGRRELLGDLPPWQTGGSMVERVTIESATWAPAPTRFEAGSPNTAGAVGLAEAIAFLSSMNLDAVAAHEMALANRAIEELGAIDGVTVHGSATSRAPVVAFTIDGVHPHDIATVLDAQGVAVRAGHHCAQPLADWLGVTATTRASFGVYNRHSDVDALLAGVARAVEILR